MPAEDGGDYDAPMIGTASDTDGYPKEHLHVRQTDVLCRSRVRFDDPPRARNLADAIDLGRSITKQVGLLALRRARNNALICVPEHVI